VPLPTGASPAVATNGNARGIGSGRNSNPRISELVPASPNPVNTKTTTTTFFFGRHRVCAGIGVTLRIPFSPSSLSRIPNARTSALSARRKLPRSQAGHSVVSSSTQTTRYSSSDGLRLCSIRDARLQSSPSQVAFMGPGESLRSVGILGSTDGDDHEHVPRRGRPSHARGDARDG
jgi:hypothetical protein